MRFPCLVLDHDDPAVQSETTVNLPHLLQVLNAFRPGQTTTAEEYARECNRVGFADFCRQRFHFTEQEILDEYMGWKEYVKTHIPDPFPGIANVIRRQRAEGGKICVVSHSCNENITRDYALHFGIQPDDIFGWDLPEDKRKPSDYALKTILEKYGFRPEELLVVDDMKLAWDMAHPLGVKVAFAGWGRKDFPELTKEMTALCDYAFSTPEALERFLFEEESL